MNLHFRELRRKIKLSQKIVMGKFIDNHDVNLCFFCGEESNLTKEHVLPQWAYEKKEEKFFSTTINEIPYSYNKATIPACARCNNILLSSLEDEVIGILKDNNAGNYSNSERATIIWWLELIGFKFQLIDMRKKFTKMSSGPFIPYLAGIPTGIMRDMDISPYRVLLKLRSARRKLTRVRKTNLFNSLVVFRTSNESVHFFHKCGDFIFLELPQTKTALFLFFNEEFETAADAHSKAMDIIKRVY